MIIANHLGSEASIASSSFNFTATTLLELYLNLSLEYLEVMGCTLLSRDALATQNESSTTLHFQFENNIANTSRYDQLFTDVQGKDRVGFVRGGRVYVLFDSDITNLSVFFSD